MNMQAETIITVSSASKYMFLTEEYGWVNVRLPIVLSVDGSLAVPAVANTKSHADCQRPPRIRGTRRPNYFVLFFNQHLFRRKEAYLFHDVQTTKGANKVDAAQDDLRHERVRDTNGSKDRRAIIEKVVCACELLQRLQGHA